MDILPEVFEQTEALCRDLAAKTEDIIPSVQTNFY